MKTINNTYLQIVLLTGVLLIAMASGPASADEYFNEYGEWIYDDDPVYTSEPYVGTTTIDNSHYGDRAAEYDGVDHAKRQKQVEARETYRYNKIQRQNNRIYQELDWQRFNNQMDRMYGR